MSETGYNKTPQGFRYKPKIVPTENKTADSAELPPNPQQKDNVTEQNTTKRKRDESNNEQNNKKSKSDYNEKNEIDSKTKETEKTTAVKFDTKSDATKSKSSKSAKSSKSKKGKSSRRKRVRSSEGSAEVMTEAEADYYSRLLELVKSAIHEQQSRLLEPFGTSKPAAAAAAANSSSSTESALFPVSMRSVLSLAITDVSAEFLNRASQIIAKYESAAKRTKPNDQNVALRKQEEALNRILSNLRSEEEEWTLVNNDVMHSNFDEVYDTLTLNNNNNTTTAAATTTTTAAAATTTTATTTTATATATAATIAAATTAQTSEAPAVKEEEFVLANTLRKVLETCTLQVDELSACVTDFAQLHTLADRYNSHLVTKLHQSSLSSSAYVPDVKNPKKLIQEIIDPTQQQQQS